LVRIYKLEWAADLAEKKRTVKGNRMPRKLRIKIQYNSNHLILISSASRSRISSLLSKLYHNSRFRFK